MAGTDMELRQEMQMRESDFTQAAKTKGEAIQVVEEGSRSHLRGVVSDDRIDGLRRLGLWITIVYAALCLANVAMGEPVWVRCALFGAWLLCWLATRALLHKRRVQWSTMPMAFGGLLIVAAQQWFSGGLMSPETGGYALVVLVSGLMGGLRLSLAMAGLTALNALVLWWAGRHGWVPESLLMVRDTRAMLQQVAIVGLASLGVAISLARIKKSADMAERERTAAKKVGESFASLFMKSNAPMSLTEAYDGEGGQQRARGVAANDAFCALFGLGKKEDIEAPRYQATLWQEKDQLSAALSDWEQKGHIDRVKARMRTHGGERNLVCLISAVPVEWEGKEAVLWTFQDVTENEALREDMEMFNAQLELLVQAKAMELEVARAQLESRERLAKLGEMVAGVAHEINTPIGNALLSASTMGEPARRLLEMSAGASLSRAELAKAARKVAQAADIAVENLARASEIIGSFKQLSADQAGKTRRVFGFDEVAGGALRMIGPTMKTHGVDWEITISQEAQEARVDGYPGALSQIVTAMALNALEHGYEDHAQGWGKMFAVRIEMSSQSVARIEFIDNGVGMKPEMASKVFEPFSKTRTGGGGPGLGLAIAWNLAREALGGTIRLVEHEKGCRFVLEMPLESPKASQG
jgi:signal transduction histidine kinase